MTRNFADFWGNVRMELGHHSDRRRGHGGRAVLLRRLEQRDVHGGRGAQSASATCRSRSRSASALFRALYLACNFVYLNALPLGAIQNAPQDRVATAVAQQMSDRSVRQLLAAAIMISTFGCVNGMLLAGARVYYAMAGSVVFPPGAVSSIRSPTRR